jgi:hypothetical protein
MEDLLQLHKSGVKIVFQAIPEEPVANYSELANKVKF